jgi:hypothetical protein
MNFLRKRKKYWAILLQVVIAFFLFFSSYSESGNQQVKTHSKTLLCVGPGATVVVRNTSEQSIPSLSFVKNFSQQEIWHYVATVHSSELLTNSALLISTRIFNPFYVVTTIHAP